MKPSHQIPPISRILWTDYPAFISTAITGVTWIVYLSWVPGWRSSGPIIKPEIAPFVLSLALSISLVGLAVTAWRIFQLRRIFRAGEEVRGRITDIFLRRDYGKVTYTFFFKNKEFIVSAPIHRNKSTVALKNGERVTLVIDSDNPHRAFIRDLYL